MLNPGWFLDELERHRIGCITGVPCSYVSGLYSMLEDGTRPYFPATAEGEAVALAAGAWLAGSRGLVLAQNSGLGNMVNPLTSLTQPFEIPVVLGVSRRGWPAGTDEPQHALMGQITPDLLRLMGLRTENLAADQTEAARQLTEAFEHCDQRLSTALVLEKGVFDNAVPSCEVAEPQELPRATVRELRAGSRPSRAEVLACWLELGVPRPTVATTGYTSRELYGLDDRDDQFYLVGSMGCAPALGAGLAVTGLPVTVLDGDGALLMRMGSLATVARHVRTPFLHVVLDNGRHESTGGQRTNGGAVDFAAAALACGYRAAWRCDGIEAVRTALREAVEHQDGCVLVHCLIRPGTATKPPRPKDRLPDLALRFRTHVTDHFATAEGGSDGLTVRP
ncbi:phosphonopyruvate decarboxylase [Nocardia tenerifensis]|uniref:Phosphonopyruvate decarboxylase n=1 Tax=Nocardia tenerifensis TaxID=228006 RepID=A0A318KF14_9NOCA|nr:phosphonopyruvate decarboxylase [Nocardia tenerifensis]PXX58137.1 phosphonopyruvate decarboxylase [Nocardia tenerifensis]